MKLNIVLSAVVIFFISCSVTDIQTTSHEIVGQWEWVKSTGGFAGHTISPDSAGYAKQQIYFTDNQKFSFFQSDTLVLSGTYFLEKENDDTIVRYEIEGNTFYPDQKVHFFKDSLILMDECADCYTNTYKRK